MDPKNVVNQVKQLILQETQKTPTHQDLLRLINTK